MKILTQDELVAATSCNTAVAAKMLPHINKAMAAYEINKNSYRIAAFLAQIGHETMDFARLSENMNYGLEGLLKTWPSRFTRYSAATYARQPEAIANLVYSNRMGNGNEASGDGWKYRGRGMIMLTGKDAYLLASASLGLDLEGKPELLLMPEHAALVAGWYWNSRSLNVLADQGKIGLINTKVNGGSIGSEDRCNRYKKALCALKRT